MMKQLASLCILLMLAGCIESSIENKCPIIGNEEFCASLEGTDSRTYVDEQIRMRWNAEDEITIFKKSTYNRTFMFTGNTGANAGGFRQTSTDDDYWFGYDVDYSYAVYPHSAENTLDETNLYLTVNMPAKQTYAENSFGLNANTMVAVSESNQLIFKNVGSYLRVRLYGENVAVSSITLTTKGNEAIAGKAKITPSIEGNPTCEMTGTDKSICLTCTEPITISSNASAPTDFWIVVPPVTLSSGFSITITNSEGNTQVFEVAKSFTFERNKYYDMMREVNIASDIPYLTFTADAVQTLTMTEAVETLEYSVNNSDWKELGTNIVVFGGENGSLRLRGKNNSGTSSTMNPTHYSQIEFGNATPVACTGDIRTLLDYENYLTVYTGSASFKRLFADCSCLISAPKLPATRLGYSCYYEMFMGCSSLIIAPELPATTLSEQCYNGMFNGCKGLTTVPKLPATTLTDQCYRNMFKNCTNLISVPQLPALILADRCYEGMFYGCSSITNVPELPATTLSEMCYYQMFYKCSNITKAPNLPATTLTKSCYYEMFYGCKKLSETPELPAIILAKSCYYQMFYNCENLINASNLPATTLAKSCYYSMFYGCSSLKTAPKLPATTLAESCYYRMFYGCNSLSEAPELPAKSLVPYCYQNMFYNCFNLNQVTMLATDISALACLASWLHGVASAGTFIKAKDMETIPTGGNGIPSNWTVINYEEE